MDDETGDDRRSADAARQPDPSTIASARNGSPPHPAEPDREELRVTPNKNRLLQVRRTGSRKLFDRARKEVFLEWLAATCNVKLSASKSGVAYQTVFKHLAKDPAFFDATQHALQLGYLRLEARSLQEAHAPGLAGAEPPHPDPLPAGEREQEEEYEERILDEGAAEEHFDAQLALQLLREHRRHLPGSAERRPAQRTTAQSATNQEIAEALAKRLKGFALRVGREEPPHPAQAPLESPSPSKGEGQE